MRNKYDKLDRLEIKYEEKARKQRYKQKKKKEYDDKRKRIKKLREEATPEWQKKSKKVAGDGLDILKKKVNEHRNKKKKSPQERVFGK